MTGVYILHFNVPLKHAKHYVGFSNDVDTRIQEHREGRSRARIMEVLAERKIDFVLARVFEGEGKAFERQLKKRKNTPKYCPICKEKHHV